MVDTKFIDAGWFIDGTGGPVREKIRLEIKNGRIISTASYAAGEKKPAGTTDFNECTVLPCLVDSHVHLCMSGTADSFKRKKQIDIGFEESKRLIYDHLKSHLTHGVIVVRDGGDKHGYISRYRNECREMKITPVLIKSGGRAWHRMGRYGGLIGRSVEEDIHLADLIERDLEEKDHVKIVNSGLNSLREFGKETLPQFGAAELSDAVRAARKKGLKVMVHANGIKPVAAAISAGCDSIEHGFFMGSENLKKMSEKGIVWVPTACTMKAYSKHMNPGSIEHEVSLRNLDHQLDQIRKARELGVVVAIGTDAGSIGVHHGSAVIDEMKLMIQAGYTLTEAVKCASKNGANLLGLENAGIPGEGRDATFIAVKSDPSGLPDSLRSIRAVCVKGIWIKCAQ
jgi:imidazolonepropionase-like amidohydrolase